MAMSISVLIMIVGFISLFTLPVEQYPDIAPTTIRITASYPGATARAVQNSVTTPIEDALTGLDGLLYTESSASTGRSVITLTFDDSVEPVDALNEAQSKVRSVESRLPSAVQNDGVSVSRSSSSILMVGALVSTGNRHSTIELGNLLEQVVEGPVKRSPGVGGVNVFGSGYAMRIWLDPLRLAQFQLTPTDITTAVAQQNSTVSVGSLGSQPVLTGQQFTATITAQSQLTSVEDFRNILLKTGGDGAAVRLGDVAEVEIGQARYGRDSRFNGMNASGFAVNLATGATNFTGESYVNFEHVQTSDGNDTIYGNDAGNFVLTENGNDYVDAGLGNDTVYGGEGDDSLYGGSGGDYISGETGNDFIDGGAAGTGTDTLTRVGFDVVAGVILEYQRNAETGFGVHRFHGFRQVGRRGVQNGTNMLVDD